MPTDLQVVFGGINERKEALDDLAVLQCDQEAWFAPDRAAVGPAARAFHAAAAVGRRMYMFGGHVFVRQQHKVGHRAQLVVQGHADCQCTRILMFSGLSGFVCTEQSPVRCPFVQIHQFNDLWCLDTVSRAGRMLRCTQKLGERGAVTRHGGN